MFHRIKTKTRKLIIDLIPNHKRYTPFIILGSMRTGSNLLRLALESCPQVVMENEIFNQRHPDFGYEYDTIMEQLYCKYPINIKAVGCKIFYDHLSKEEWNEFSTLPKCRIIHLMRRNKLRNYLSLKIAEQTDRWLENWLNKKLPIQERRVFMNKQEMFAHFHKIEAWEQQASQQFKNCDLINIYYEDLIMNYAETVSNVTQFLGVKKCKNHSMKLRKQNPESMQQLILNYEEVERVLSNTPFQVYLEEDNI